jgi:hypothetical protein
VKNLCFLVCFLVLLIANPLLAHAQTIIYIPEDNRPVCLDYVTETAQAAGVNIIAPPATLLAGREYKGNADLLWTWLLDNVKDADALVVSSDSLLYGGLVSSRTHSFSAETLEKRLANFAALKQLNPTVRLYVFGTIMRTPHASAGGVEPDYYEEYGPDIFQLTALQDKAETGQLTHQEQSQLQALSTLLPKDILTDWFARRSKNYALNVKLLNYVKKDIFDYLILGRDDCSPLSQSHKESRHLAQESAELPVSKYTSFPGADQLGMLMVIRAINDYRHEMPVVGVNYAPGAGGHTIPSYEDKETGETINLQIISAGGILLSAPLSPDLIIAVNTPENGITLEAGTTANQPKVTPNIVKFVNGIEQYINERKAVAVGDISFANGADNGLMRELSRRKMFPRLAAYSGWNTASNTLGYAISQGMLAKHMNYTAKNRLITVRLLDDWAYQANIRTQLVEEVLGRHQENYFYLDDLGPLVTTTAQQKLSAFAKREFPYFTVTNMRASFPWNRMFEVQIDLQ